MVISANRVAQIRDGEWSLCGYDLVSLCDSHEALRGLLRRVAHSHSYNADTVHDDLPADLRAEVDAAVEGG